MMNTCKRLYAVPRARSTGGLDFEMVVRLDRGRDQLGDSLEYK